MTATARTARLLVTVLALAALALVASGCGDDKQTKTYDQSPLGQEKKVTVVTTTEFNADQQAVIETIAEFADATAQKDYAKICSELLTETSRQLGGGKCEQFFKVAGKGFKDFSIKVQSVTLSKDGNGATVKTITSRDGQPSPVVYSMKKNAQGQWQVAILGQ